jgi:hypothetical protein
MIVTFQSKAAGDVILFADVAERLLTVMGKDASSFKQGILTPEQLPSAIDALRAAMAEDKARHAGLSDDERPQTERNAGGGSRPYVSLTQRAAPLLELCERAQKKAKPVVWGV